MLRSLVVVLSQDSFFQKLYAAKNKNWQIPSGKSPNLTYNRFDGRKRCPVLKHAHPKKKTNSQSLWSRSYRCNSWCFSEYLSTASNLFNETLHFSVLKLPVIHYSTLTGNCHTRKGILSRDTTVKEEKLKKKMRSPIMFVFNAVDFQTSESHILGW